MGSRNVLVSITVIIACLLTLACNTTKPMKIPVIRNTDVQPVDVPINKQVAFALQKVVASIRRGTPVVHFPGGGSDVVDGYLCNYTRGDRASIEWSSGSRIIGNWRSELGEVFYETLSEKGINVVGDPSNLFDREKAVQAAEYLVGARVTDVKGNFCEEHHWWDGRPLDRYSGEMFVAVEWTVFSNFQKRRVLKFKSQGYFRQKEARRGGIGVALNNAFANATERMLASKKFVELVSRRSNSSESLVSEKFIQLEAVPQFRKQLRDHLSRVLASVVTVRVANSTGSGFLVSKNGLILSNEHVVGKARKLSIVLSNGLVVPGEVIRVHAHRDVALIKATLNAPSALPIRTRLAKQLEKVYVIGTPVQEALRSTVTSGIVSALRIIENRGKFIQSDAAISGGNSGGPLLDAKGNVLGISVSTIVRGDPQNLNLFIPINDALEALNIRLGNETN